MNWNERLSRAQLALWRWVRHTPALGWWSLAAVAGLLLVALLCGYHDLPAHRAQRTVFEPGHESRFVMMYEWIRPYLRLSALLGSLAYLLHVGRVWPRTRALVWPTACLCVPLALWAVFADLSSHLSSGSLGTMGEPASPFFYTLKLVLLAAAILSVPVMVSWWSRQKHMDRYLLRAFVQPVIFCLIGFASLKMLSDLIDNLSDYQSAHVPMLTILGFYVNLLPNIYVEAAPLALMLAVLYTLTRMSRTNELISMLTSGRSLGQILRPLVVISAYGCFLAMVANYHWGPRGQATRDTLLRENDSKAASIVQNRIMYHDEGSHRTWFISAMPFDPGRDRISQLEVRQFTPEGKLKEGWIALSGRWTPQDGGLWIFLNGVKVSYKDNGEALPPVAFPPMARDGNRMSMRGWPETPWSIVSGALQPDNLSVPDLVAYLRANPDARASKLSAFHAVLAHRFALPWQPLALVLLAAPLGISFSRRGAMGGIAAAVIIFFGLLFCNNLFLNLAKGGHWPAWLAAWMPHLILLVIGLPLFLLRARNRDLPKFTPSALAQCGRELLADLKERWSNLRNAKA